MQVIGKYYCYWVVAMLVVCSSVLAAQPPSKYHPGDTVKIVIMFDGKDAGKLAAAQASMTTGEQPPKDQAGFHNNLTLDNVNHTGPGTFEVSGQIPDNVATGIYRLTQIRAQSEGVYQATFVYSDRLPDLNIMVENAKHFEKPSIKSVKEVSKPKP
jgi:hypothetical protein